MRVTFYSKENCSICVKGLTLLESLREEFSFTIDYQDIYQDDHLLELYMWRIPVVSFDGHIIDEGILSEQKLRESFKERR